MMRRNIKGFTLVEMLFAFALFGIVATSSAYLLLASKQLSNESRQRMFAINAARSVLETVKQTPLANVGNINTAAFLPTDANGQTSQELPSGNITITTNPANLAGATLATVTITVRWMGPRNMPKAFQVSTMRSSY